MVVNAQLMNINKMLMVLRRGSESENKNMAKDEQWSEFFLLSFSYYENKVWMARADNFHQTDAREFCFSAVYNYFMTTKKVEGKKPDKSI